MASDRNTLCRHILRAAIIIGKREDKPPKKILEDLCLGRFETDFQDGKTVISTSEAGGTTTFAVTGNLTPDAVMSLVEEVVTRLESGEFGEEANPTLSKRIIKRLRVSFGKAMTS